MPTPNPFVICSIAFLAVFVVLTVLAAVMRVLIVLFPPVDESPGGIEPALVTAITEGVKAAYPGTKVTGIEEVR